MGCGGLDKVFAVQGNGEISPIGRGKGETLLYAWALEGLISPWALIHTSCQNRKNIG